MSRTVNFNTTSIWQEGKRWNAVNVFPAPQGESKLDLTNLTLCPLTLFSSSRRGACWEIFFMLSCAPRMDRADYHHLYSVFLLEISLLGLDNCEIMLPGLEK